jgi:hypothetical protein
VQLLVTAVRTGTASALEATEAAIARIEALGGLINAVVVRGFDRARPGQPVDAAHSPEAPGGQGRLQRGRSADLVQPGVRQERSTNRIIKEGITKGGTYMSSYVLGFQDIDTTKIMC